jgi:hypothetical protein
MKKLLTVLLLFTSFVSAESSKKQVLIIGDSISLGYTPHVVKMLEKEAVVKHNKGNAGPTLRGLAGIDSWLEGGKWDVIHFNWGLWDMYRWRYEKFDQSPEAYEKNLEKLVTRLEKTGAKLIWGTTTPACPEGEKKIKIKIDKEAEAKFLAAALRVMKKHNVHVNDLNAFMYPKWEIYKIADNDVHYNKSGYKALAQKVAEAIKSQLK